jgi:hypothetical protein
MSKTKKYAPSALTVLVAAAILLTCQKVPDYCGKGVLYDPGCQFCFAYNAYDLCGGRSYNPLTEGCVNGNAVGTKCQDGSAVPAGSPCDGYKLTTVATPSNGGAVTRAPDRAAYHAGEQVSVSAVP